jgi:hypothetical protein
MTTTQAARPDHTPEEIVPYVKERIYVTFIGLAVLLGINTHAAETEPLAAVASLVIAAVGAGSAGLVSEIIAHLAAHGTLPTAAEFRHQVRVSLGALATVILPVLALLLAVAGLVPVQTALTIAIAIMAITLGAVGYLSVFRSSLRWWAKLAVFFALVVFGLVVILVQLLAHG